MGNIEETLKAIKKEDSSKGYEAVIDLDAKEKPDSKDETGDKGLDIEKNQEIDLNASQDQEKEPKPKQEEEKKPEAEPEKPAGDDKSSTQKKTAKLSPSAERKMQLNRDIGQLVREKNKYEEDISKLKAEQEDSKKIEVKETPAVNVKPKLEQFKDGEGYLDETAFTNALDDYHEKEKIEHSKNIDSRIDEKLNKNKVKEVETSLIENANKIKESFYHSVDLVAKDRPDGFKEAVNGLQDKDFHVDVVMGITESVISADLAYFYSQNKDAVLEMKGLTSRQALKMLWEKENELIANNSKKLKSDAPPPITPGKSSGGGNKASEGMDATLASLEAGGVFR